MIEKLRVMIDYKLLVKAFEWSTKLFIYPPKMEFELYEMDDIQYDIVVWRRDAHSKPYWDKNADVRLAMLHIYKQTVDLLFPFWRNNNTLRRQSESN